MAALGVLLAACVPPGGGPLDPNGQGPGEETGTGVEPSARSKALAARYARTEARFLSQGLLRSDGGGPDTPYGAGDLTENFIRIALFDEYEQRNGRFIARPTPSFLRRWEGPVRLSLVFGPSTDGATRDEVTAEVARYAARLARVTGHDIRLADSGGNFTVLYMTVDELAQSGGQVTQVLPGIDRTIRRDITGLPPSITCVVYSYASPARRGTLTRALAVIRAEHPKRLRQSCIHEEIAQGLGLVNDSPQARPSIFNDDEEFGLLTSHDEALLGMLYDRRLRPGMTPDQARPIVSRLAAERAGPNS